MFRCELCKKTSKPYERPVMFLIETREKEYPERENVYGEEKHDPGGFGYEIAKEIRIHLGCMPDEANEEVTREAYLASLRPKSFSNKSSVVSRRS